MAVEWWDYITIRHRHESLQHTRWTYPELHEALEREARAQKSFVSDTFTVVEEARWEADRRPYYKLYPGIVDVFVKQKLERIETKFFKIPTASGTLLIKIPKGSIRLDGVELMNIFVSHTYLSTTTEINFNQKDSQGICPKITLDNPDKAIPGIWLSMDTVNDQGETGTVWCGFDCLPGTFMDMVRDNPNNQRSYAAGLASESMEEIGYKIVSTCLLLEQSIDVISPEVLSADLAKYGDTQDQKYVDKAKRRGKYGWVIGRDLEGGEVMPHVRNPHWAWYHTGPGRLVPIYKRRKGSIVHRKKGTRKSHWARTALETQVRYGRKQMGLLDSGQPRHEYRPERLPAPRTPSCRSPFPGLEAVGEILKNEIGHIEYVVFSAAYSPFVPQHGLD